MKLDAKRALDVVISLIGLIALAPVMAAIALAIRFSLGTPVLFRQRRPGLHGQPFVLLKFRTMLDERDASGLPLPDGQRTTALGRFLRRASLDELPELFNVLRGEMSLVGPRPLLSIYLDHYTPTQRRRHDVRPGITGWAQVNGRNDLSWDEKLKLDVWYVDHASLWLDLQILWRTVIAVISQRGTESSPACVPPALQSLSPGQLVTHMGSDR